MNEQSYLGDGLYCEFDGYQYRLFTQQGNEVFLDEQTLSAFVMFIKKIEEKESK